MAAVWSYLGNTGDRRLAGITSTGLAASQSSANTYTTAPESFISGISENSDTAVAYPSAPMKQTAGYNLLNELTSLSGQGLGYDAVGNLLSDGTRNYAWDAENRLVTITYPNQPGTQTHRPPALTESGNAAPSMYPGNAILKRTAGATSPAEPAWPGVGPAGI